MRNYKRELEEIDLSELLNSNSVNPIQYQYFKSLEQRRIIINDPITDDMLELAILPLIEMDNDGSNKPIEILLNSPGGSVYAGFQLIDTIEKAKSPIIIKSMAMSASMACLVAMAGRNNPNVQSVCSKYTVFLLHSGSDCMQGTTNMIKDQFRFSEKYEEKIEEYILTHSKITKDLYDQKLRHEWWMIAEEALEMGIVDQII